MNTAQINPDYLRGLLHIAADKDMRFYLNAVLVEIRARETRYVATNGHMLALLRDELPDNEPDQVPGQIIIPRETCKAAKRHKNLMAVLHYPDGLTTDQGTRDVEGELPECRLEALKDFATLVFRPVNAKYPDYTRVIPTEVDGKPGAFQWKYAAAFDQLAAVAWGAKYSVDLYPNGVSSCALVLSSTNPGFVGALMPLRGNNPAECPELPQWFTGRPDLKVAA